MSPAIIESLLSLPTGAVEAPFSVVCLEAEAVGSLSTSSTLVRSVKIGVIASPGIKQAIFLKMAGVWGSSKGYGMAGFVNTPFGFCSILIDKPERFEMLAGPPPPPKASRTEVQKWERQAARRVAQELRKAGFAPENARCEIFRESIFYHLIGESTPTELLQFVGEQAASVEQAVLLAETRAVDNRETAFAERATDEAHHNDEALAAFNKIDSSKGGARKAPRSL